MHLDLLKLVGRLSNEQVVRQRVHVWVEVLLLEGMLLGRKVVF